MKVDEPEKQLRFKSVHYVSAIHVDGVKELLSGIRNYILPGPPLYPNSKEDLSEHPVRFFVSELIREQLFLLFHEDIPYSCTVEIVQYKAEADIDKICADNIVNRKSQRGMLIGKKGAAIKELGIRSWKSIEKFVGKQVCLELHVST